MPYFLPSYYPLYIVGGIFGLVIICFFVWIIIDCFEKKNGITKQQLTQVKPLKTGSNSNPSHNLARDMESQNSGDQNVMNLASDILKLGGENDSRDSCLRDPEVEMQSSEISNVAELQNTREKRVLNPDIYVNPLVGREGVARYPT